MPVPDDDADAMKCLCLTLHFKNSGLPAKPKIQEVRVLAILVDKYDCVEAVRYSARCWLQDTGTNDDSDMPTLTACAEAAWLLHDTFAFKLATKALIRQKGQTKCKTTSPEMETVISNFTRRKIRLEATRVLHMLLEKMKAPGEEMTGGASAFLFPSNEHGHLMPRAKYSPGQHDWLRSMSYGILTRSIERLGASGQLTIKILLSKYSGLVTADKPLCCLVDGDKREYYPQKIAGCRACQFDIEAHFKAMKASMEKEVPGLCLDCMKKETASCAAH